MKSKRIVVISAFLLVLFAAPIVVYATGYNQNISNSLNEAFSFVNPATKIANTLNNSFSTSNNGMTSDLSNSFNECFNDTAGGTCISSTIVQPINCQMQNNQSAITVSLSGGSPSPSTFSCDGTTHNISINPSTSFSLAGPAQTSTLRDILNVTSSTSCAAGTCSTLNILDWHQFNFTLVAPAPTVSCQVNATNTNITGTGWCNGGSSFKVSGVYSNNYTAAGPYFIAQTSTGFQLISNVTMSAIQDSTGPCTVSLDATDSNISMWESSTLLSSCGSPASVASGGKTVNAPSPTWYSGTQIYNWQAAGLLQQVSFNTPTPAPNPNQGCVSNCGSSTPPPTQTTTVTTTTSSSTTIPTGPSVSPNVAVETSLLLLLALGGTPIFLGLFYIERRSLKKAASKISHGVFPDDDDKTRKEFKKIWKDRGKDSRDRARRHRDARRRARTNSPDIPAAMWGDDD